MADRIQSEKDQVDADIRLFEHLRSGRSNFESLWEQIARRIYPNAKNHFQSNFVTKGEAKQQEVFDSTGAVALNRFAAILDSLLTPRNQTWHRLIHADENVNKDRQARLWFEDVNRLLFKARYMPSANYASQNHMNFKSLGAFGSGSLYIDGLVDPFDTGLRYKSCHLGQLYFIENHQGIIDGVIRHYCLTARQAVQKFPKARLPGIIAEKAQREPEVEYEFLHVVMPNEQLNLGNLDFTGMRFASRYISLTERALVDRGGFDTFPYTPSRYEQAPNEVYGRSPAMDVLPSIKTLNEMKKTMLKQGHRVVDPVLLVHDDGVLDNFSLKPGAANAGGVNKDGKALVQTLPVGNISAGKDMQDEERSIINDTFLVTLFQILVDSPQMTATEVLERTREKGILLAPTVGRQQSERLGPQIDRELDVMSQLGMLPPVPPILEEAGTDFEVVYDSPLSRAQRAEEASGLMRTVESTLSVANVTGDPSPLDHFNWDIIVPELSDINAVPARWRRSMDEVSKIRQGRAQAQQEQQALEAAPSAASIVKAVQ